MGKLQREIMVPRAAAVVVGPCKRRSINKDPDQVLSKVLARGRRHELLLVLALNLVLVLVQARHGLLPKAPNIRQIRLGPHQNQ